jgi:hypothetical protein
MEPNVRLKRICPIRIDRIHASVPLCCVSDCLGGNVIEEGTDVIAIVIFT